MEYCCHVWARAPSCYLELLDKLQKQIYRTVGAQFTASVESLVHCRNVASIIVSIGITLVDVCLNRLNWFHFVFLNGGLLVIKIDCIIFLSPFIDVTRISISTVSFFAQLDSVILYLYNAFH